MAGKFYAEMTAADWLRAKQLAADDVPRSLVMVGEDWNPGERLAELQGLLDTVTARPRWNVVLGDRGGTCIGLANVCWGPMAAMVAHQFYVMGTEQIILVGYCGAIVPTLTYGDVLVVDEAVGEDGASRVYAGPGAHRADRELATVAADHCARRGLRVTRGRAITTDAMLLEDRATVDRWAQQSFDGVDGETASVYAVAKRFGRRAIALLTCSDSLVAGDTLYSVAPRDEAATDATFDAILEVALDLAAGFSSASAAGMDASSHG